MSDIITDAQLVQKALKNPDEYALIIDRFEGSLARYILRITRADHEDVEELLQTIFIKAYRSLNGFDTKLKLSSWLYRIAHNVCVDYLRKSSKKNHLSLDAEDEYSLALIDTIASEENTPFSLKTEEQRAWIRKIIQMLPEKYRTVIVLFFAEGKSYDEMSDILQIPVNSVWTLLSRAKKHFFALSQEPQFSHLFTYV